MREVGDFGGPNLRVQRYDVLTPLKPASMLAPAQDREIRARLG